MHRWQKTRMTWECNLGLDTSVPVTDWHDPQKKHFHGIHKIEAIALPDRKGQVELLIQRVSVSPTTERTAIYNLLSKGIRDCRETIFHYANGNNYIGVKYGDEYSGIYMIEFSLANGDQFCDIALEIVRRVLRLLGVEDNKGYRLADFTITQETYCQIENAWITYARWLRIQKQLPIHCSADDRKEARAM